jgi:cytochrome d ubiquinol oxidase subunit I
VATLARRPWLLRALAVLAPAGFVAIEAGWTVTEVGRQPWVVQGILRTADAVTPMPGLVYPLVAFTLLYVFLAVVVAWLLWRQIVATGQSGGGGAAGLTSAFPVPAVGGGVPRPGPGLPGTPLPLPVARVAAPPEEVA